MPRRTIIGYIPRRDVACFLCWAEVQYRSVVTLGAYAMLTTLAVERRDGATSVNARRRLSVSRKEVGLVIPMCSVCASELATYPFN